MPKKKPKRAKYPSPLIFEDYPFILRFRKSPMVGDILVSMRWKDKYGNLVRFWMPLGKEKIVALQKWLARWRKSHETNWGSIEK